MKKSARIGWHIVYILLMIIPGYLEFKIFTMKDVPYPSMLVFLIVCIQLYLILKFIKSLIKTIKS